MNSYEQLCGQDPVNVKNSKPLCLGLPRILEISKGPLIVIEIMTLTFTFKNDITLLQKVNERYAVP